MTLKCLVASSILLMPLANAQTARQPGAVYDFDVKGEKPAPAPVRDAHR